MLETGDSNFIIYKYSDDGKEIIVDYSAKSGESWNMLKYLLTDVSIHPRQFAGSERRYVAYHLDKGDKKK
ncbi:hypothetical protein MMC28_008966 [Mycoblastus sanguinarius]|nr:hypothetical protein [Mycoblastus sanguinarius]